MKSKTTIRPDRKALYFQALQMSIDIFMDEERKGYLSAELRLMKAIEAARTLYKPFETK